jgi:sugar transferase EpsL
MSYRKAKRTIDFLVAAATLLLLSPILLIVALLVRLINGGPVIFRQLRPGLHGKPFMLYKFRTMSNFDPEKDLTDEARINLLGRLLRSTSLDELPELINVIKGEMSLVGPRPLLIEYLESYTARQMRRHEAIPGITGLAQIKGRNTLTWERKFRYDLFYVEHQNIKLDLYIIFMTLKVVILKKGFKVAGEGKRFSG